MKASRIVTLVLLLSSLCLPDLAAYSQKSQEGGEKVTVTAVQSKPATITLQYTCRIESQHHIEVRAPNDGYLEEIFVKEGQPVKQGDLLFKFVPVLQQARLDSELAEVQIAQLEFNNAKKQFENKVVSQQELQLHNAKLAKANARAKVAEAELGFTNVRAPFDGIIDRFSYQQGSLVLKGEALTNLYDNTMVHAYFNVPESRYLEYMAEADRGKDRLETELSLANGKKYPQRGKIGAIEATFNPQTGTIAFRADFPNPDGLLRHGQTGTLLFDAVVKDAVLIPQRATFEDQARRYVYLVDQDRVAHRREIVVHGEIMDLFVVTKGVKEGDVIVDEGVKLVHDGEKVESEDREPKD